MIYTIPGDPADSSEVLHTYSTCPVNVSCSNRLPSGVSASGCYSHTLTRSPFSARLAAITAHTKQIEKDEDPGKWVHVCTTRYPWVSGPAHVKAEGLYFRARHRHLSGKPRGGFPWRGERGASNEMESRSDDLSGLQCSAMDETRY